jgi:hypothetical protein
MNTAPVLRMRGGVCRCLTHARQRTRVRVLTIPGVRPCKRVRAHVCSCVGAPASTPSAQVIRAAVDRRVVGSQAFSSATAFNANIGAWNTARMTDLTRVCTELSLHL